MLTPHCSAVSGMVAPSSTAPITRARKSSEYGFAIHAGLLPVGSLNHIRAGMGIPSDSAFSENALMAQSPHAWKSDQFGGWNHDRWNREVGRDSGSCAFDW